MVGPPKLLRRGRRWYQAHERDFAIEWACASGRFIWEITLVQGEVGARRAAGMRVSDWPKGPFYVAEELPPRMRTFIEAGLIRATEIDKMKWWGRGGG